MGWKMTPLAALVRDVDALFRARVSVSTLQEYDDVLTTVSVRNALQFVDEVATRGYVQRLATLRDKCVGPYVPEVSRLVYLLANLGADCLTMECLADTLLRIDSSLENLLWCDPDWDQSRVAVIDDANCVDAR